jgi:hyperosmotically inducible periplasmic protein
MALAGVVALSAAAAFAAPNEQRGAADTQRVAKSVRKALVTLPYTGVFDNLAYQIDGDTVTLHGQVVRPSTRSDAERRVRKIEGVARVVNQIEVLPLSSHDDSIRRAAYRRVFGTGGLYRYAMGANPSLRLVVNRGHLTLEGVVANEFDRNLAYIAARQVPGAFSVTNNLRVEGEERRVR